MTFQQRYSRLKILMAPHWCCRVTPRAWYSWGRYPGKTLVLEKSEGSWWSPKWRFRSKTKIGPWGAYPRILRFWCCGDRYCCPICPPGVGFLGKLLFSSVNVFVGVGNDLPATLPHDSPRLKILMPPDWCCRVTPPPPDRVPGWSVSWETPGANLRFEPQSSFWTSPRPPCTFTPNFSRTRAFPGYRPPGYPVRKVTLQHQWGAIGILSLGLAWGSAAGRPLSTHTNTFTPHPPPPGISRTRVFPGYRPPPPRGKWGNNTYHHNRVASQS